MWAVMLMGSVLYHMEVVIPLLFLKAILIHFCRSFFIHSLTGKMGITQSSQMTLPGFCVHENMQSSLDAIKTATETSVLLKMRQ